MEPTDDKWDKQIMNLLSNYVADLVFDRIDLHNTLKIRDSIDSLLCNPSSRSWGGKLFERAVHHAFCKGFEFEPEAMDDDAPSLLVQIKKAESVERYPYESFLFYSLFLYYSIFLPFYFFSFIYIPIISTQVLLRLT